MTIGPSHLYLIAGRKKGISEDILRNSLAQAEPLQEQGLPPILTLNHFAHLAGVQWKYLRQIIGRRTDNSYRTFRISKRKGGKRLICIPDPSLRRAQVWINNNILSKVRPHWRSYAYFPGSSIVSCAKEHCNCRWLIKIDIQHFFESVTEKQVYEVFLGLGYQPLVSFELARICTRVYASAYRRSSSKWQSNSSKYSSIGYYKFPLLGHLPQGAPSSPMLSNLVCRHMDELLYKAAKNNHLVYTRYADDLIFSSLDPSFTRSDARMFIRVVYSTIRQNGFEPHMAKTTVIPPGARKIVLGLLVDRSVPRVTRDFRNNLEHHIWAVGRFGLANHASHAGFDSVWGFKRHIEGLINFARMVDRHYANELGEKFAKNLEKSGWVD